MNITLGMVVIGVLAIIGALWMFAKRMRQMGEASIAADIATETADTMKKMDQAGAEARSEDVVDRLRKGGF